MADNKSNYLENAVLNHVLRGSTGGTSLAQPANVYVALYTVTAGESGGGTEVLGNAYARQVAAFSAPVGGQTANSGAILFPISTAAWGTLVGFGLHDALTGGNLLYFGLLSSSVVVDAANRRIELEAGSIVVQEL